MSVTWWVLTSILVLDALWWWSYRRRPGGLSTMGHIGRMLITTRIVFKITFWIIAIAYVALLIWAFTVGPIKPIHEWFTH
jgi:hypothetical protein